MAATGTAAGKPKIEGNAQRDRRYARGLREAGLEGDSDPGHELKASPMRCFRKIPAAIGPEED